MHQIILSEKFYNRDTVKVAQEILGKILIHEEPGALTAGIIVETEAYLCDDPACHASRGITKRNSEMFGPPGMAYVYLIYGIHYCFNTVTREEGTGEAVLIRSLKPLDGLELMRHRRGAKGEGMSDKRLSAGPGNLCRAMGINKKHNGISLMSPPLYITDNYQGVESYNTGLVVASTRIGISKAKELNLRYYLKDYIDYVSRR